MPLCYLRPRSRFFLSTSLIMNESIKRRPQPNYSHIRKLSCYDIVLSRKNLFPFDPHSCLSDFPSQASRPHRLHSHHPCHVLQCKDEVEPCLVNFSSLNEYVGSGTRYKAYHSFLQLNTSNVTLYLNTRRNLISAVSV